MGRYGFIESSENMAQKKAALACSVCGSRNYTITLGQNRRVERLEIKKFCKYCNKQTLHRETNKRKRRFECVFLSNVIKEMKKVTWPTGKEVNKYTITVIMTVLAALCFFCSSGLWSASTHYIPFKIIALLKVISDILRAVEKPRL